MFGSVDIRSGANAPTPMKLSHRIAREDGFTLIEVLIVLLVLGILAAVSLASFAGKDQLAMDAEAKQNVSNLFRHVQSCYIETEDYTLCDQEAELRDSPGFVWGTGAGQIEIRRNGSRTTRTQVTIRATSRSVTNGTRHRFTYIRRAGPPPDTRTCRTGSGNDAGGCNNGAW